MLLHVLPVLGRRHRLGPLLGDRQRWVWGTIVRDLPASLRRRPRGLALVVRPNLVAADLGAEPPAAEAWPVALVPEVDHHVQAIDLLILLEGGPSMVLSAMGEAAADDGTNGWVLTAANVELWVVSDALVGLCLLLCPLLLLLVLIILVLLLCLRLVRLRLLLLRYLHMLRLRLLRRHLLLLLLLLLVLLQLMLVLLLLVLLLLLLLQLLLTRLGRQLLRSRLLRCRLLRQLRLLLLVPR
mmetsp:Transcript_91350/g.257978  ORF Transcript_91350/g.257978 Transcript_91350/m.257978 type:complete len:240 (+) Transcript_91350:291-1010(+)